MTTKQKIKRLPFVMDNSLMVIEEDEEENRSSLYQQKISVTPVKHQIELDIAGYQNREWVGSLGLHSLSTSIGLIQEISELFKSGQGEIIALLTEAEFENIEFLCLEEPFSSLYRARVNEDVVILKVWIFPTDISDILIADIKKNELLCNELPNRLFEDFSFQYPSFRTVKNFSLSPRLPRYTCLIQQTDDFLTLAEILQGRPQAQEGLPFEEFKKIAQELIAFVFQIHSLGIVHHNITLKNVIYYRSSDVFALKGFDFCSKILNANVKDNNFVYRTAVRGDPVYMSRQMLEALKINKLFADLDPFKHDIFALGILLLKLRVNQNPFNINIRSVLLKRGWELEILISAGAFYSNIFVSLRPDPFLLDNFILIPNLLEIMVSGNEADRPTIFELAALLNDKHSFRRMWTPSFNKNFVSKVGKSANSHQNVKVIVHPVSNLTYEGELNSIGQKNGKGEIFITEGLIKEKMYEGDWHQDLPNGKGELHLIKNLVVYSGRIHAGFIEGEGSLSYKKEKIFEGAWIRNLPPKYFNTKIDSLSQKGGGYYMPFYFSDQSLVFWIKERNLLGDSCWVDVFPYPKLTKEEKLLILDLLKQNFQKENKKLILFKLSRKIKPDNISEIIVTLLHDGIEGSLVKLVFKQGLAEYDVEIAVLKTLRAVLERLSNVRVDVDLSKCKTMNNEMRAFYLHWVRNLGQKYLALNLSDSNFQDQELQFFFSRIETKCLDKQESQKENTFIFESLNLSNLNIQESTLMPLIDDTRLKSILAKEKPVIVRELNLNDCPNISEGFFVNLSKSLNMRKYLNSLRADNTRISNNALDKILSRFSALKTISIRNCPALAQIGFFAGLFTSRARSDEVVIPSFPKKLEELNLDLNIIGNNLVGKCFDTLRILSLRNCKFDKQQMFLKMSAHMRSLEELDLGFTSLESKDLLHMKTGEFYLRKIKLDGNDEIKDDLVKIWPLLKCLVKVRSIWLGQTQVTDRMLEYLETNQNISERLEELDLSCLLVSGITKAGTRKLLLKNNFKSLKILILNGITAVRDFLEEIGQDKVLDFNPEIRKLIIKDCFVRANWDMVKTFVLQMNAFFPKLKHLGLSDDLKDFCEKDNYTLNYCRGFVNKRVPGIRQNLLREKAVQIESWLNKNKRGTTQIDSRTLPKILNVSAVNLGKIVRISFEGNKAIDTKCLDILLTQAVFLTNLLELRLAKTNVSMEGILKMLSIDSGFKSLKILDTRNCDEIKEFDFQSYYLSLEQPKASQVLDWDETILYNIVFVDRNPIELLQSVSGVIVETILIWLTDSFSISDKVMDVALFGDKQIIIKPLREIAGSLISDNFMESLYRLYEEKEPKLDQERMSFSQNFLIGFFKIKSNENQLKICLNWEKSKLKDNCDAVDFLRIIDKSFKLLRIDEGFTYSNLKLSENSLFQPIHLQIMEKRKLLNIDLSHVEGTDIFWSSLWKGLKGMHELRCLKINLAHSGVSPKQIDDFTELFISFKKLLLLEVNLSRVLIPVEVWLNLALRIGNLKYLQTLKLNLKHADFSFLQSHSNLTYDEFELVPLEFLQSFTLCIKDNKKFEPIKTINSFLVKMENLKSLSVQCEVINQSVLKEDVRKLCKIIASRKSLVNIDLNISNLVCEVENGERLWSLMNENLQNFKINICTENLQLNNFTVDRLFEKSSNLKALFFEMNLISGYSLNFLKALGLLRSLHILSLKFGQKILDTRAVCFLARSLDNLSDIEEMALNFRENAVENEGLIVLSDSIGRLHRLRKLELNLNASDISIEGVWKLFKTFSKTKYLESLKLDLGKNNLSGKLLSSLIAKLVQIPNLLRIKLGLSFNNITDDEEKTEFSPESPTSPLVSLHLNLKGNQFKDPPVALLNSLLLSCKELKELKLNLSSNNELKEGIEKISSLTEQNKHIRSIGLNLQNLKLSPQQLDHILLMINRLENLIKVNLKFCEELLNEKSLDTILKSMENNKKLSLIRLDLRGGTFNYDELEKVFSTSVTKNQNRAILHLKFDEKALSKLQWKDLSRKFVSRGVLIKSYA